MRWPLWRVAVAEASMQPALRPGDVVLVWRGLARAGHATKSDRVRIRPGQIVIARNPARQDMLVVKRAAWLEPDGWWLDSDNKLPEARDSAHFGLVPPWLIEGRVLTRCWPPWPRRARGRKHGA